MIERKKILCGLIGLLVPLVGFLGYHQPVAAFSVTPMKQTVSLTGGDTYTGRVSVFENDGASDFYYSVTIQPLSVDDSNNEYSPIFGQMTGYTDIVNWVTISNGSEAVGAGESLKGVVKSGEVADITYTINVPKDARGGGQYFAVKVSSRQNPNNSVNGNVAISDSSSIASIVYAEIAGEIIIKGSVENNNFPRLLASPPLVASFIARNEGNTHVPITYYMQVFPILSDEEIYTTEENSDTKYVLPGTQRYIAQTWDNTPSVGVFKVRQTVYYGSTDNEPSVTEKIVVICPIWLLFIIIFVIFALVFYFVARARARKKAAKK